EACIAKAGAAQIHHAQVGPRQHGGIENCPAHVCRLQAGAPKHHLVHQSELHIPHHPWTNGQVERMNRTIKEATVNRYHYDSHNQLRAHLVDFVTAYNFARRLKILKGPPWLFPVSTRASGYICSVFFPYDGEITASL